MSDSQDRLAHPDKTVAQNSTLAVFAGGTAEQFESAVGGMAPAPYVPPVRRRSFGKWFADTGWRHVVAIMVSVFAIFPLLYVLSSSLNPRGTLTGSNQLFFLWDVDAEIAGMAQGW